MRLRNALALVLLASAATAQTTWYVSPLGSDGATGGLLDPFETIQFAIARPGTLDGDTVMVLDGTYAEAVDFVGKAITVKSGSGPNVTIIDATGLGTSTVRFVDSEQADSVLQGFTVTGGTGTADTIGVAGGGIDCRGSAPTVIGCRIVFNEAEVGGAIYLKAAAPTFEDCAVVSNSAIESGAPADGGAVYAHNSSSPTFDGCIFRLNEAHRGGALFIDDSGALFDDCIVEENVALSDGFDISLGGAVYATSDSNVTFDGGTIAENRAPDSGNGGAIYSSGSTIRLLGVMVQDNEAGDFQLDIPGNGGAVYSGGSLFALDTTFENNGALIFGGAVTGAGIFEGCTFRGNRAQFGGAVYTSGAAVEIRNSLIEANRALSRTGSYEHGGGVAGPALVTGCVLRGNDSFGQGGAAHGAMLVDCLVEKNMTRAPEFLPAEGGGLYEGSAVNTIFRNNVALAGFEPEQMSMGGAAYGSSLERCVLIGNEADYGGGAYDSTLVHCSVAGNVATMDGGGVHDSSSLLNSILWGNAPSQITAGSTATYCDIEGGFPGTGNFSADPLFWNPVSGDLNIMVGSPCVDAGDPLSPLDGDGSIADVGAFPVDPAYCGTPGTYCVAKENSQGCLPSISFSGSPTLSGPDDFVVSASDVINQQFGILFWGLGDDDSPFLGGTICVETPVIRTPEQNSGGSNLPTVDCSGTFDFAFTQSYLASQGLGAGSRVYAQYWYRDPSQGDGTGVGLSNALEFTVCP